MEELLNEMEELNDAFNGLLKKGMIEVVGINEDGQPLYQLTEAGEKVSEALFGDETNEED
jgi:hypothetical protein